ncbi:hypothetical protein M0638_19925 [Roseomonas sp. NAR14]|uniref:Uncharacterized protein n=1 Tax=Roseomonas acroporae TaxID=2937791 RepID=A0A9X1YAR0_9PROT|nr:hypothetical protein [Roseomonas acroporae]MCK8786648.1 hypothetical protein [Roseomonas acroporae]
MPGAGTAGEGDAVAGGVAQPGVARLALVAIALLLGGIGLVAYACSEDAGPVGPFSPYLRLGPAAGAAALKRDLEGEFLPGTPAGPLVRRLEGMGMNCDAYAARAARPVCVARVDLRERRVARVEVLVREDAGGLIGVVPDITVTRP